VTRQLAITITAALLLAAVVVIWRAPPTQFLTPNHKPPADIGDADSFMRGIATRVYASDGSIRAKINAIDTQFYRRQQNATLNSVTVTSRDAAGRPIALRGDSGRYQGDGSEIELNGNVVISLQENSATTELRGEQFSYQMLANIITSRQALTMHTANGQLSGAALYADLEQQLFTLTGDVRGRHQPQ